MAGFSFFVTFKLHKNKLDAPHTNCRRHLKGKTGCPSHKPVCPEMDGKTVVGIVVKPANRRDSLLQPDMTEILKLAFHPGMDNWNRGRITPGEGKTR